MTPEQIVAPETAQQHIRNALQIIQGWPGSRVAAADLAAVEARLWLAVRLLEAK